MIDSAICLTYLLWIFCFEFCAKHWCPSTVEHRSSSQYYLIRDREETSVEKYVCAYVPLLLSESESLSDTYRRKIHFHYIRYANEYQEVSKWTIIEQIIHTPGSRVHFIL